MAAATFEISYGSFTATFDKFSDDTFPGTFVDEASLEFSAFGVGYSSGPVRRLKKIFSISAYVTKDEWNDLIAVHTEWDKARASGSSFAEVSITNSLFDPENPIETKGFFTSQPQLQKLAPGNNSLFLTTFVLQET